MRPLNRLYYWREQRALTQREVAERAGISPATVVRLEGGQRPAYPSTVRKLAKALRVKPAALYGEDSEEGGQDG